jgi:hypothetical protein
MIDRRFTFSRWSKRKQVMNHNKIILYSPYFADAIVLSVDAVECDPTLSRLRRTKYMTRATMIKQMSRPPATPPTTGPMAKPRQERSSQLLQPTYILAESVVAAGHDDIASINDAGYDVRKSLQNATVPPPTDASHHTRNHCKNAT